MKYLVTTAILISTLTFTACDGPVGPQGPPGIDGVDGQPGEIGFVMEFEGIDLTASNEFSSTIFYNDFFNFEGLESDVALAYLLDGVDTNTGEEVWLPLPQLFILGQDLIQYNYDFTASSIRIFLEANFDLNLIDPGFTDNNVMRVVIVPGDFVGGRKTNEVISYEELEEKLGLPELKRRSSNVAVRRN
ncbi:MAG: collagen-like protein [Bacteroidota bacterium]